MSVESAKKNKKSKDSGIALLSSSLIIVTIIIFCLIIFISFSINTRFNALKASLTRFIICEQTSEKIKSGANDLTELVRLFIINQDERFALAYLEEIENTNSQKNALENLQKVCSDKDLALQRLAIAITQAESITQMELYAMRLGYEFMGKSGILKEEMPERLREIELKESDKNLSKEEMQNIAIKSVFGNGFLIYKLRINENCNITVNAISEDIKKELSENADKLGQSLDRLRILILALLIVNILSTIGLRDFKKVTQSYNEIYEIGARKTKKLLKNAEYDALTDILNRRAYEQICKTSSEQRRRIALLLIDLDNFKQINDTYGHTGGDTALKTLASILKETFRDGDYVARIGGDEFAVVLADFKPEGFKIISEKINYVNERLSKINGITDVSISVGMAYSATGYSEELYKQADKALYAVKNAGKAGCRIYDSTLE
ncbi:MAG: GGDEF domain-containing protein [Treponema sp.]|nr:GGDEF domain-containing protein [Treponema sp.]